MAERKSLEALLKTAVDQNAHFYFQPPEGLKMQYPAVVYKRSRPAVVHADNKPYKVNDAYNLTYITRDPDSEYPDKLARLPMCSSDTNFVNDNLYHWVYTIYYK